MPGTDVGRFGRILIGLGLMLLALGTLCITLAELWYADRDGLQGAFLQPIAPLLARKATPQTARARAPQTAGSYAEGPQAWSPTRQQY